MNVAGAFGCVAPRPARPSSRLPRVDYIPPNVRLPPPRSCAIRRPLGRTGSGRPDPARGAIPDRRLLARRTAGSEPVSSVWGAPEGTGVCRCPPPRPQTVARGDSAGPQRPGAITFRSANPSPAFGSGEGLRGLDGATPTCHHPVGGPTAENRTSEGRLCRPCRVTRGRAGARAAPEATSFARAMRLRNSVFS